MLPPACRFVPSSSRGTKCPPARAPQHGAGLRPTGVHTALTRCALDPPDPSTPTPPYMRFCRRMLACRLANSSCRCHGTVSSGYGSVNANPLLCCTALPSAGRHPRVHELYDHDPGEAAPPWRIVLQICGIELLNKTSTDSEASACMCRRVAAAGGRKDPWFQYLRDFPGLEGVAVCKRVRYTRHMHAHHACACTALYISAHRSTSACLLAACG